MVSTRLRSIFWHVIALAVCAAGMWLAVHYLRILVDSDPAPHWWAKTLWLGLMALFCYSVYHSFALGFQVLCDLVCLLVPRRKPKIRRPPT